MSKVVVTRIFEVMATHVDPKEIQKKSLSKYKQYSHPLPKHDGGYQDESKDAPQNHNHQQNTKRLSSIKTSKTARQSTHKHILPECDYSSQIWGKRTFYTNKLMERQPTKYPFAGMLVLKKKENIKPLCSATLLFDGQTILTAAHCMGKRNINDYFKRFHFLKEKYNDWKTYWCPLYYLDLLKNKVELKEDITKCSLVTEMYVIYPQKFYSFCVL